jgi:Protein of unknown function (DUF3667)
MIHPTGTEPLCKNCEAAVAGKYCSNCGQSVHVPRFTFKHIFEEAFHAFTHADKSFPAFVKQLFINPGKVAYEYIVARKRKKYYNPFTFFLLISAINAFVVGEDINLKDRLFNTNNTYGHLFNVYNKLLELAVIPVVAFFIWLINLKKPRLTYSEYTVFAMIMISLLSMVDTVAYTINYACTALLHRYVSVEDNIWYLLLMVVYIAYASYGFHVRMHKNNWVKNILAGLVFALVTFAVQLFIIYAFINDFQGLGKFSMWGVRFGY